jgi:glycosyltransferase involved in cell wall biosynthesis
MQKNKVTVCTLAFNEEKKIRKMLESVKDLADEIIVGVDDKSTDNTLKIAKKFTSNVFELKHNNTFHSNKQEVLDKVRSGWILWMDSDEEMLPELKKEIGVVLKDPRAEGYMIPRKNIIFSKWIENTGWAPDYQLRLFKQGLATYPCERIHENPVIGGKVEKLENPIKHYNYESVFQFIDKLNRYTSEDAKHLNKELKDKQLFFPLITRPVSDFIKRYLAFEGYKDGFHGLVLSLLQSFYELVTVVKVWELRKFDEQEVESIEVVERKLKTAFKDWKWWKRETVIREAKIVKRLANKFLRRFSL